jgi:hypothetical protein
MGGVSPVNHIVAGKEINRRKQKTNLYQYAADLDFI